MTAAEDEILVTFRKIKQLSRTKYRPGKRFEQIRRKLLNATLELQVQLKRLRHDSTDFRPLREHIDAFLLSPLGITLRRHAAKYAKERAVRRKPRALANPRSRDSTMYGKHGFLSKFHAAPINLDTKRALGL